MTIRYEWRVVATLSERSASLTDYADETLRDLVVDDLVPPTAWVERVEYDFNRRPVVTIRWDTERGDVGQQAEAGA